MCGRRKSTGVSNTIILSVCVMNNICDCPTLSSQSADCERSLYVVLCVYTVTSL